MGWTRPLRGCPSILPSLFFTTQVLTRLNRVSPQWGPRLLWSLQISRARRTDLDKRCPKVQDHPSSITPTLNGWTSFLALWNSFSLEKNKRSHPPTHWRHLEWSQPMLGHWWALPTLSWGPSEIQCGL